MRKEMQDIKIEKGVPLPSAQGRNRKEFPWEEIEEGDSFLISGAKPTLPTIINSAKRWGVENKYDMKITSRKEGNGWRYWLIKKEKQDK